MANFTAAFTAGATLETWTDPATVSAPGRLNPSEGLSHKRYKATVGVQVTITMTQNGVVALLDSGLSGFVFKPWHLETPDGSPPGWSNPAGQSSVQRFTPTQVGHYALGILFWNPTTGAHGGSVIVHIDAK